MDNLHQIGNTGYTLSIHAERRAQQRGIKFKTIEFILQHADTRLHSGAGCMSIRISEKEFARLAQGGSSVATMGRAKNVVIIFDLNTSVIVSLLHDYGSKDSRRYRCQFPTRSRKAALISQRVSGNYSARPYYPEASFQEHTSNEVH